MRERTDLAGVSLGNAIQDRLRNQIVRAFRHTYGAEQGLQTLVQLAAAQMLEAGASRADVHRALTDCVVKHPSLASGKASLLTGESRSQGLTKQILLWADEACGSHGVKSE
jgi:hypothetical protein